MKKLLIIIIILAIILVGLVTYKNVANNDNVNIEEISRLEEYIKKIYMWKEVTNEALPEFDNINNADELWIWEVVKKDLEETDLTYDQIENKKKEIFGEALEKSFPLERK